MSARKMSLSVIDLTKTKTGGYGPTFVWFMKCLRAVDDTEEVDEALEWFGQQ